MTAAERRAQHERFALSATDFMEKLGDEVYRAERYGVSLSVVVARAQGSSASAIHRFIDFAANHLRRIDAGTTLGASLHALCLPHTPRPGAEHVAQRLRDTVPGSTVSVATFPQDGRTAAELLAAAERLLGSPALMPVAGPQR